MSSSHARRAIAVLVVGALAVLGVVSPVSASAPLVKWDAGESVVSVGPMTFTFGLGDFNNPSEILRRQTVDLAISTAGDQTVCASELAAIPLLNGTPVEAGVPLTMADEYDYADPDVVSLPVSKQGTYSVRIEGTTTTSATGCSSAATQQVPFTTTIDLFSLSADLPGPASTTKVTITSSGPHTLVARTSRRAPAIRITFTIKDPEKRSDLHQSMCMTDTDDCWIEDAPLKKSSSIRKTATGWIRTWDFWWERSSPSDCLDYYWNQPDVSVIMVVSNRDGKVLGHKKHTVYLTCR